MSVTVRPEDAPDPARAPAPIRRYQPQAFELRSFGRQSATTASTHLDIYQAHVMQTNAVLEAMAALDGSASGEVSDPARPAQSLAQRLSFELGAVLLHELFFSQYLDCSQTATGSFELAACHNFGSLERWKSRIRALARSSPGWVVTLFDPHQEFLHNLWVGSHDLHVPAGLQPVFVLDLWEHAWLADYGAKGLEDYVEHALLAVSLPCLDGRIGSGA